MKPIALLLLGGLVGVGVISCSLRQQQVQPVAPAPVVVNPEAPVSTANQQAGLVAAAIQGITGISHQSAMSATLAVLLIFVTWQANKTTRLIVTLSHNREIERIKCKGGQG